MHGADRRAEPRRAEPVGGNVYDKYATRNPIARHLMRGFLADLDALVARSGASEVHELGCGEGELSLRLARRGRAVRASDVSAEVIAEARRRARRAGLDVDYREAAIESLGARDAAELVVCCEVIEHLEGPAAALEVMARLARPWLIASVPREPLWRALNLARLRYLASMGNTPGHRQRFSSGSFVRLLERCFEVVELRHPLPWTLALCRVADR